MSKAKISGNFRRILAVKQLNWIELLNTIISDWLCLEIEGTCVILRECLVFLKELMYIQRLFEEKHVCG